MSRWYADADNLLPLAIFALVGLGFLYSYWRDRKRRLACQALAAELGFTYEERSLSAHHAAFHLLQQGRGRLFRNLLRGSAGGIDVLLADYQYTTGSGKNSSSHIQTVCILTSAALKLPACSLRPQRRFLDFLGSLFGGQDIEFPEDPAFSGAFVLQGEEEAAARALFHPAARACLTPLAEKEIHLETRGDSVLLYRGERRIPLPEMNALLETAFSLFRVWST